ncbi:cell division protein FtsZ [Aquabacterium sp. A7-Y]|uniref:cell division protein ZipA C-terminal FtsZ-binding domain-containing protein n=1 Tax=Aquabacterium sp. A7-Y TaxID=1349605 RepID=UPI00223DFA0C|nr:cell division protein ZipA C-terminal FtsZ-binding domain-containing protein [Aquabacterium sp. A7-Y]MCW7541248.1 cell division protein FtsZ [Aquabacterium sp. A7-Y]
MSSLQVALAVLGGLVLAGVVAHGAWQSRKAGIRQPLVRSPKDLPPAIEPSFGPVEMPDGAAAAPAEEEHASIPPLIPSVALRRQHGVRLDPLIDAMATLAVDSRVSGDNVLAHLPPTRRAGSKPFFIEGQNEQSGEWETPHPGQTYRQLQAGVQLANRTGALNEIEYSEFVQKLQGFADAMGAAADFPDMLDEVGRARELDQFASQHDAQLICHLLSRGAAWAVSYIQQHAVRHGFVPGVVPGRLVLPAREEGAPPVLSLQFDPQAAFAEDPHLVAVRHVTLSFDVPQTAASEQPFQSWQSSAEALARDMEAVVVDDNHQPLSPAAFEAIGRELEQLYRTLEERGLAAGSPAARRVFS